MKRIPLLKLFLCCLLPALFASTAFRAAPPAPLPDGTAAASKASALRYSRLDQWYWRRYRHSRSTGFNSGAYAGNPISVRFGGAVTASAVCPPAPSQTRAP